jgi:hypothetical protein
LRLADVDLGESWRQVLRIEKETGVPWYGCRDPRARYRNTSLFLPASGRWADRAPQQARPGPARHGGDWLARAGCTLVEICAISGHSPKSVQTIVEHYLGSQRELADAAIAKLVAWMQREGIAV